MLVGRCRCLGFFELPMLSSEPIGARGGGGGPRELELQAASARRLAELQQLR